MERKEQKALIIWKEKEKTLTLTGEPVLELSLSWPQVEGKRMRGVSRYYQRLCQGWEKQWGREGYWCACADLAQKRAQSRPFAPWKARLSGQVTREDENYFSIAMAAREEHGDGRVLEYRWGDTWRQEDGCPVGLKELFPGNRRWRKELLLRAQQAAHQAQGQGVYLNGDWEKGLRRWFSPVRFALGEHELLLYYPQCTLAPAVEGAVELRLPLGQT